MNKEFITQTQLTKNDIKNTRTKLGMSQKEFAKLLNVSTSSVEKWETKDDMNKGMIAFTITMLNLYPEVVEKLRIPKKIYPLRLFYMHHNEICTIIDVDDRNKNILIYNYKQDPIYLAFGNKTNPDYNEYLDFLKSRCFPQERDNMKLILKDLNIPYYDPFLIIEKTKGYMAEDNFWIDIER